MAALLTCSDAALTNFHTSLLVPVFLFFFFYLEFLSPPLFLPCDCDGDNTNTDSPPHCSECTFVHARPQLARIWLLLHIYSPCVWLLFYLLHTHIHILDRCISSLQSKPFHSTICRVALSILFFVLRKWSKKSWGVSSPRALFFFNLRFFNCSCFLFFGFFFFSVVFFSSLLFIVFGLFRFDYRSKNRVLKKAKTKIVGIFLWAFVPRFRVHSPLTNSSLFNYNNFKCVFFFNLFFPLFSFYRQLEQCYAAQSAGAQTHAHAYV